MRYTVLVEDKGFLDFSPCDAGTETCDPGHKFGPHVRNYYLIHFVIGGRGRFRTPRGDYNIEAGSAFIIKPTEVTVYQADERNPWEYMWLGFRGGLADTFLDLPDVFEYDAAINDMLRTAIFADNGREALLTGVLYNLYARYINDKGRADYPNRVKSYINAHYMEDITIASVAENLGLNRKYLARLFKEKHGISMQEFLIDKRLHEAKKLLKQGYNVEECAYMVGYNDPFGFSKAFKKKYGISPIKCKKSED